MSASKAAVAIPERPAVMGPYKPDWIEKPSGDDMEWAYPAHAQRHDIEGKAVIRCAVGHDGRLSDCQVISETPMGEDFGVAAVALSQKFRMLPPPEGYAGKPAEVTIPVVFQVPESNGRQRKAEATLQPKVELPATPLDSGDILLIVGLAAIAFALLALLFAAVGRPGRG